MNYIYRKLLVKYQSVIWFLFMTAVGLIATGCNSGTASPAAASETLQSIEISQPSSIAHLNIGLQFTATGKYLDNNQHIVLKDITKDVSWSSSASSIAAISNTSGSQGLATALIKGDSVITASLDGVTSPAAKLKVSDAALQSIEVATSNQIAHLGVKSQLTATGVFSDHTTQDITSSVSWSSADSAIATISNTLGSKGLFTPLMGGNNMISASLNGITSIPTNLKISMAELESIVVTPLNATTPLGVNVQYTATGMYDDGSTLDLTASVVWISSDISKATIINNGLATPVGIGSTNISASFSGISSIPVPLTIVSAELKSIHVTPQMTSTPLGVNVQFTAMGTYSDNSSMDITSAVIWASSVPSIATISNTTGSNGLATSVGVSSSATTISASLGSISDSTGLIVTDAKLKSITITPDNSSVAKGSKQQFIAMGTYTDNTSYNLTSLVTWSSSNIAVAVISNANDGTNGLATTTEIGTATITAIDPFSGIAANTTLKVTGAKLLSIAVTPANSTIPVTSKEQFTAIGTYSDNTTHDLTSSVSWSSSNTAVAIIGNKVCNQGLAFALNVGTTQISATDALNTAIKGSTNLKVTFWADSEQQ